jgi:hypothetical protein
MEWITVKEASELVKKSESTIKRAINQSNGDLNGDLKNNQILYKKKPAKRGYYWFVEKNSLLQFYYLSHHLKDQKDDLSQPNGDLNKLQQNQINNQENTIKELNERLKEAMERLKEVQYLLAAEQKARLKIEDKTKKGMISGLLAKYGL